MKYIVDLNGARREVEVDGETVRADDHTVMARLDEVEGTPVRLITIGSEVHRVVMRRGPARGAYTLWVDGFRFEGEALDERTRTIRDITAESSRASGPASLVAPMPGLIVRVSVAPGDTVQAGQGLIVMEAMKMENELRASASGTVKNVLVAPGKAVEKGMVLVEFDGASAHA